MGLVDYSSNQAPEPGGREAVVNIIADPDELMISFIVLSLCVFPLLSPLLLDRVLLQLFGQPLLSALRHRSRDAN